MEILNTNKDLDKLIDKACDGTIPGLNVRFNDGTHWVFTRDWKGGPVWMKTKNGIAYGFNFRTKKWFRLFQKPEVFY
jgi:frataxin-like iron-binding protein CyaY